jgi:hypothetical protein
MADDVYLGGDAELASGDSYDPYPAAADTDDGAEQRELERRVDEGRTPVYPLDDRRRLPLPGLWRRWRAFAMRGRADVVDDFGRDPIATARWEWVLDFLYAKWFRTEVRGLEHVPATAPAS